MGPYILRCTLDIICETAMGKKMNTQTSSINKEYLDAVNGICESILNKAMKPWLRITLISKILLISTRDEQFLKTLKGFTEQVIQARRMHRNLNSRSKNNHEPLVVKELNQEEIYGKNRKAFLDLLLDLADINHQLSDDDIREEVETFMFEGHDTTAMSISWSVLLLGIHPRCQKLIQEEIQNLFAGNSTKDVATSDLSQLKYLYCFLKESLRLYPSAPFITRHLDTDFCLDNGLIAPKGATAMIHIYSLHRLPENFPQPEEFIPERWQSENKIHAFGYIPFSAGSRNCIGQKFAMMEEKIILVKLLRTYTIETHETMETLQPVPHLVLRNKNGVQVRLRKRQHC